MSDQTSLTPCLIVRYDEIGLKGHNRLHFEQILSQNIQKKIINQQLSGQIVRYYGRLVIFPTTPPQENEWQEILGTTFGLANFSFGWSVKKDWGELQKAIRQLIPILSFATFRLSTQRTDKNFPLDSLRINQELGQIVSDLTKKKVDLHHPECEIVIEVTEKDILISHQKHPGLGGLPVGSSGRAVTLLSGGIDSPVAAYLAMKRGLELVYVHFHSAPYTDQASQEKVKELKKRLDRFHHNEKLIFIPFGEIQKQIMLQTPDNVRIILYRRYMLRLAEKISEQEKAMALVTGDALGQVASQTLTNLRVISDVTKLLILRPLISFDKNDTIKKAKEIGTYEVSILPHQDCCSVFLPKRPDTQANLEKIIQYEKDLPLAELLTKSLEIK